MVRAEADEHTPHDARAAGQADRDELPAAVVGHVDALSVRRRCGEVRTHEPAEDADDPQRRRRDDGHGAGPWADDDGVPGSDDDDVLRVLGHPKPPKDPARRQRDREQRVLRLGGDERYRAPAAASRAAAEGGHGRDEPECEGARDHKSWYGSARSRGPAQRLRLAFVLERISR